MALISGGADRPGSHDFRPHARRCRAAFLAIKALIVSGTMSAERAYLSPPTATSDGTVDWLNTRVCTSDVVALCRKKRWRVRFEYAVELVPPIDSTPPSASVRRRFSHLDKSRVINYLETCSCQNGDKSVALAEETFGIDIGQARGRKLWKEAGRYTRRGKRPRPLAFRTSN